MALWSRADVLGWVNLDTNVVILAAWPGQKSLENARTREERYTLFSQPVLLVCNNFSGNLEGRTSWSSPGLVHSPMPVKKEITHLRANHRAKRRYRSILKIGLHKYFKYVWHTYFILGLSANPLLQNQLLIMHLF